MTTAPPIGLGERTEIEAYAGVTEPVTVEAIAAVCDLWCPVGAPRRSRASGSERGVPLASGRDRRERPRRTQHVAAQQAARRLRAAVRTHNVGLERVAPRGGTRADHSRSQ